MLVINNEYSFIGLVFIWFIVLGFEWVCDILEGRDKLFLFLKFRRVFGIGYVFRNVCWKNEFCKFIFFKLLFN